LAEDSFVVSLPPPLELAVFGSDLVVVVVVVVTVVVAAMTTGSKVDGKGLGLTDGERTFLPSSMSRSKTNPMTALRCGVRPSAEVLSEVTNNSSLSEDFRPVSNNRRSSFRIVECLGKGVNYKSQSGRGSECSPCGEWGEKLLSDVCGIYLRLEVFESEATKGQFTDLHQTVVSV